MKILLVEDNLLDAELTGQLLKEEWPAAEVSVVSRRQDFVDQLKDRPDLVLSDFSMAEFDGGEAFALCREQSPTTPFIFFSGTIGEERAIDALRAGAADYLLKDRPKRLVPAVARALKDAELKREKEAAAEQMQKVQRLENLGMLAAGIAHDFNNVLAPVLMGVSLLETDLKTERERRVLSTIQSSAGRGVGLVKQILGFANGVSGERQIVQAKHLLREMVDLMNQTFPKSVHIEEDVDAGLWPIKACPTQLHQVLLNLCVNARDAMPRGGTLTLRASNLAPDESEAAVRREGVVPSDYVEIAVSDTGEGIPPAIRERIWDAFFTTKGSGKGTGLGLATVKSIVEEHRGAISLKSELGVGTCFRILFPAERHATDASRATKSLRAPVGGGELVIVADDDENVRDLMSATLAERGYKVLAAASGTEALALIAPRFLEVKVLISDFDMPGLDGVALSSIARSLNPSIRIILASGSPEVCGPLPAPKAWDAFLPKPFGREELLETVAGLIGNAVAAETQ